MAYPKAVALSPGNQVHITTYHPSFVAAPIVPGLDTHNKHYLLNLDGELLYAEIAVVRLFEREGWGAVWVDNYRKRFRREQPQKGVENSLTLPEAQQEALRRISGGELFRTGTWDIFAWHEDDVAFAELKLRASSDHLRENQIAFLKDAHSMGVPFHNFLIIEWDKPQ